MKNREIFRRADSTSVFVILKQWRLRWLGPIRRMEDGRLPKEILYGEIVDAKRPITEATSHGHDQT